jgi:AraC family transcriptional regulator of adaptative response/methylated-DNA-[protein]-cysteine methyltransferase
MGVKFMNSNYNTISQAIEYLAQNFKNQPELDEVAEIVHLSPFHFQRMFSEWVGISPKRFLQFLTASYLKEKLAESSNLIDAAESAGLSAQSRVYDLFVTLEAVTPHQYKTKGEGLKIEYGFHNTPFGECFIATTEKGICGLSFIENISNEECLNQFKYNWKNAAFSTNQEKSKAIIDKIFDPEVRDKKLHLIVKGTNFQVKVWDALIKLPFGSITTYQKIAEYIGSPKAVRAVGSAVGDNSIAYLIPCHRVIRKEGKIGEYRWGSARKKVLLGWESAKAE